MVSLVIGHTSIGNPIRRVEKEVSGMATERHKVFCFVMLARFTQMFCFGCRTFQLIVRNKISKRRYRMSGSHVWKCGLVKACKIRLQDNKQTVKFCVCRFFYWTRWSFSSLGGSSRWSSCSGCRYGLMFLAGTQRGPLPVETQV